MSRAATAAPPTPTQTVAKSAPLRREILTRDPEIHARARLDEATVEHYATLMRDGAEFPALVVFDDGEQLYIADGFLRDAAAERAGFEVVLCEVRRGTRRDAVLFAMQANAGHGLQLSDEDKRRAVEKLLADPEWSKWSNQQIAAHAGAGTTLVGRMRRRLQPEAAAAPRMVRRKGQVYKWTPPKEKASAPDFYRDWPYYVMRFSPEQFVRWKQLINLSTDRKVLADATKAMVNEAPAQQHDTPAKPESPTNYIANWLYYLAQMTPAQLVRWRTIIKSRVDLTILAEAVDIVMREAAAQAVQQLSGRVTG